MTTTSATRYPVMWNERTKKIEPVTTLIDIDMDKLAEQLARKAMKSKTGKASALFGAIRVSVKT